MTDAALVDQQHRALALDVSDSYIVQAPAGSGKTELLTLRYLKLIAGCDQPEEVLAITFTRKAASEMRARILNLLRRVHDATESDEAAATDDPLEKQRLDIGRLVLARNEELGWRLLENPSRLRVQTIDSFCHYLAAQLPVLSRVGGNPEVSEDIEPCFADAVENTLAKLESDGAIANDVEQLLRHLDNDRNRAQRLLISLLYKRDQWLSYVLELGGSPDEARRYLLGNLRELIEETLAGSYELIADYQQSLLPLLDYALENMHKADDSDSDYVALSGWPPCSNEGLPEWLQIVDLLLTKSDTWRKQVNVKCGFPPGKKGDQASQNKQQMVELLGELAANEALRIALAELRALPGDQIDSEQWQFLTALLNVLADLAKELQLSFRRFAVIDHAQTSAAALAALGSEQEPTDIALALDHRLQHILVDEFQDTSKVQLALLKQLTAGWQNGDGRTLFLVGDAMQSCYGFRDANVGIYLDVRERGINDIYLTPLTLQANFRSQQKVVQWVNQVFADAFPERADASRGAVPYSASVASHDAIQDFDIRTTLVTYGADAREIAGLHEADLIVQRIQELQASDPQSDIAILVRSRSHFEPLIPRLRSAGIHWQATDIDRLASEPVVSDLLSLTKALVNPADRLAWLATLRAPWCGIDTSALQTLCELAAKNSIFNALCHPQLQAQLSAENFARLKPVAAILGYAMHYRSRMPLHQLIEASWTLLRGPACCPSQVELDCARRFLQILREQETADSLENFARFEEKLQNSYVPSAAAPEHSSANGIVHLLTMHKAKGLEYDHVILPALTQKSGGMDAKSLLLWHERLNANGMPRLFLGSLSPAGSDDTRLYAYLKKEKATKETLESTRLLYIAVTRAIKSAHLFGRLALDETDDSNSTAEPKPPGSNSLLARIWPQLTASAAAGQLSIELLPCIPSSPTGEHPDDSLAEPVDTYRRFAAPLQLDDREQEALLRSPEAHPGSEADSIERVDADTPSMQANKQRDESGKTARHTGRGHTTDRLASVVGTLIHEALEVYTTMSHGDGGALATAPPSTTAATKDQDAVARLTRQMRPYWRTRLGQLDLGETELEERITHIVSTLQRCLTDEASAWLFAQRDGESQSELSLVSTLSGQLREHKVDRTLLDDQGTRWIVDYKTAQPRPGQSEDDFIAVQLQEHAAQLDRYRGLFGKMEERPTRTALYLTALAKLVEYGHADAGNSL